MTKKAQPVAELEVEARAINAQPWDPPPGMVKRRCPECCYWFATPEDAPTARASIVPARAREPGYLREIALLTACRSAQGSARTERLRQELPQTCLDPVSAFANQGNHSLSGVLKSLQVGMVIQSALHDVSHDIITHLLVLVADKGGRQHDQVFYECPS